MLSFSTGIFYYDLPTRSIRHLPPDLSTEETIAGNVVCSPLAVSSRILCARVEGIFEIPREGGPPKVLTTEPLGLVTAIAASNDIVVWINDTGREKLTLRTLPLSQ